MTKKIVKKENFQTEKVYSEKEVKGISIFSLNSTINGSTEIKRLAEKDFPKLSYGETIDKDVKATMEKVSMVYSQESGYALLISVSHDYKGFALQLRESLQKEFDCKTASEIALVDHAVNAHIRELSHSTLLELRNTPRWISREKVALLSFYSKEIDRAHRQFISAIEALKSMKQPALKVSIKTNNAFVAQNQQNNNYSEQINESK
jgi:hypothetical protein